MPLKAVFFDVGETLIDEERLWRALCADTGLQPHVVWAALGTTIAHGEEHTDLWRHLGIDRPATWWENASYELGDLYPDAIPCLEELSSRGLLVGIAGNQNEVLERWARESDLPADIVTSSASIGARKPDVRFFEEIVRLSGARPNEVAYVGDRVDNDVLPALGAGLVAIHVRRGPWGLLQRAPVGVPAIDSLAELAGTLASLE